MNNRMKVLHVGKFYPPHRGGMESNLQTLSDRLSKHMNVEVLVSNDSAESKVETINEVKVFRAAKLFDLAGTPMCPSLASEIRRSSADVVHVHWPNPAAVVAYIASGRKGPLVVTWHSDVVRQKVLEKLFRPVLDKFLARCDAIIVTSPNYLETSPMLKKHRHRCRVVPLGIETASLVRPNHRAITHIREQLGSRVVLAVGRLVYYKGFEYLIRAMRNVDASLAIIGEGPLRPVLDEEIRRSEVGDRVTILDHVDDLAPYYHASDLFVLPSVSRSEAFGLVQLEAMACGKPVVNTALDSGVPFVSPHFATGITIEPRDSDSLAHAINFLMRDPALRARLGRAARVRVEREFSVDRMMKSTLRLYSEATAAGSEASELVDQISHPVVQ